MKKKRHIYSILQCIGLYALILLMPAVGFGIVLHENGEPNLLVWTDKPENSVVGRWSSNASFVVVSPKWIITTRHQGTNPATVDINGITYACIYNTVWTGGPTGNADIRLIRLKNLDGSDPNLAYAPPHTTADEISKLIVIGGFGRGRELTLYGGFLERAYGYTWGTGINYNNNTLRWCTNIVDGNGIVTYIWTSNVITAHFNDPYDTIYEGITAEYDSGGGWFIKVGDVWKTAGLTRAVEMHGDPWPAAGESWYRESSNPKLAHPDYMDAVRISSYAEWIQIITTADCNGPGPVRTDLTGDCKVDIFDLAELANQWLQMDCTNENNFCGGADFEPDGDVDMLDFASFAQNWLIDKSL